MYPFRILSIDLRYPFHIPSLELCIAFTAVMALSLKCSWINHKTRKFSQPQNAWPFCTRFLPTEMTDLPTLSYTSTSEIPTLSYPWPEAWERYPFRAEPLRVDHYREHLPSGSNPNRCTAVVGTGGRSKGFRWAKLTEKKFTTRLVSFFFFIFSFLCSLTVSPFLMLFSLTTEPDSRLDRPFHIGTFLPSRLNKLFSWKNIPVERAVLPFNIEHTLKLEPGC